MSDTTKTTTEKTVVLADAEYWKLDALCGSLQLAQEHAAQAAQQALQARDQFVRAQREQAAVLDGLAERHGFVWRGAEFGLDRSTLSIVITPSEPADASATT